MKMFELYYSTGGHGGPYQSVFEAKTAALRMLIGNKSEYWIDIKLRSLDPDLVVARITREHLDEFFRMGELEIAKLQALFHVHVSVELDGVSDSALNNSEVLHPDVLDVVKQYIEKGGIEQFTITLIDAFEYGTKGGSEND
jgi:hypothetical protein